MTRYTGDGRAILAAVKSEISTAGTEMEINAAYDHLPVEHRARIRSERVRAIQEAREAARRDLSAWAAEERASATKRLAPSLGTAAEEARRMSEELRITRLVESNRESRGAPDDLADRAAAAYARGDKSEARVLAEAARELRPMQAHLASEILANLEADEILADPQRARALRDLNDVEVVVSVFERDVAAATSKAFQQSAKLALALGDGAEAAKAMRDASADGRAAKLGAFLEAQRLGVPYQEPEGVVHGLAVGVPEPRP
jgi:hypothetical protein